MKKRLLAVLLALSILLTCTVPVFAQESTSDSDVVVITDEVIEAVYDAHLAEKTALEGSDKDKVIEAFDGFMNIVDTYNEFEREHMEKLADMMGLGVDDARVYILGVHIDAGIVSEVEDCVRAFTDDPDQGSAYDFVEYYDVIFNDPEYSDPDVMALVRRFFPDIDDVRAEAMALLPSEEVIEVFDAFSDLSASMHSGDLEMLTEAQEGFDQVQDIISEMSEEDFEALASLIGCDVEDVDYSLQNLNKYGSTVVEMGKRYNAYSETPDKETAGAFVECYDVIFNDPSDEDEALRELVREYFYDIDAMYSIARALSKGQTFIRLSGKTRTETALAISKDGHISSEVVVLASGSNYADALAGVPLAYAYNAPILLISGTSADKATFDEIKRLGATDIMILGGEAAISAEVEKKLKDMGCTVFRDSGKTRYETSVSIAVSATGNSSEVEEVFFVSAENYPDALSVSTVAAQLGAPILFIGKSGELNSTVAEYIKERKVERAVIIGGTGAIGASAEENIKACGVKEVKRIYGKDRYDTCVEINKTYSDLFGGYAVTLATGENFPDALAGGVFAADQQAPVLLVKGNSLTQTQLDFVRESVRGVVYVFGGSGAVSDKIAGDIAQIVIENTPPVFL